MESPAFAADPQRAWGGRGRKRTCTIGDIAFTAHAKWYGFGRWTITGVGKLALPAQVVIYVSRGGPAHGYWRNAAVSDEYFGYCDAPALMPLLVGPKTRRALAAHDDVNRGGDAARDPIELHIKDGEIETKSRVEPRDAAIIDAHLAVHAAVADDHADLLDVWKNAAAQLRGIVSTSWPPILTVPRAFGSTAISLRWPTSMHSSASASIELVVDARKAKPWTLEREATQTPNARMIGGRPFLAVGDVPLALDKFASIVTRAQLLSISVRRYVTVRIAQQTPDPELLEDVLYLVGEICGASSEPYR